LGDRGINNFHLEHSVAGLAWAGGMKGTLSGTAFETPLSKVSMICSLTDSTTFCPSKRNTQKKIAQRKTGRKRLERCPNEFVGGWPG